MKIFIVGAGQVGTTIVDALNAEHDLTVLDLEPQRLTNLAYRYDVRTVEANGASRKALTEAGIQTTDLFIACTSRDETNLVAAAFARTEAPKATTVIRTSNVDTSTSGRRDGSTSTSSCPPRSRLRMRSPA
jgi:trk system potassium uptake protein TrkA